MFLIIIGIFLLNYNTITFLVDNPPIPAKDSNEHLNLPNDVLDSKEKAIEEQSMSAIHILNEQTTETVTTMDLPVGSFATELQPGDMTIIIFIPVLVI